MTPETTASPAAPAVSGANPVSVVIVAYNNWPDLELAIASALHQSHRPLEVIVVDNASTDATAAEVQRQFGDCVRYVRQENRGDGGGYNTGLHLARGEYVQFLDGDDILAPTKIEKQAAVLRTEPAVDIAYGDVRQFQSSSGPAAWVDQDTRDYADMLAVLLAVDGGGAGLLVQSALFRRSALARIGPWDERLYVTDQEFWLRAAWLGCRFRHVPGALCFYRRRSGQMSADALAMAHGMAAAWEQALTYISREPYRSTAATYLARLRLGLALTEPGITGAEACARLRAARAIEPAAVPAVVYGFGLFAASAPGVRRMLRSRILSGARRAVARLVAVEG